MQILLFTHYFPPEGNAPASRAYEHCVRWARAGHDVTVVTSVPNVPDGVAYPGFENRWQSQTEFVDGIRVVRVWTYLAPNAGSIKRIANYVSYMLSACRESTRVQRPDVIVATTPQFFCGWAGVLASRMCRVPLVLEVRDIWPESIKTVGAMKNARLLSFLERLEQWMYRSAAHIVTVGEGYRENILSKATVANRISVISNGVDLNRFAPGAKEALFLRKWDLQRKFVCSYVGTLGMAHGLRVVIDAAHLLRQGGRDDIRFCLVGDGAERCALEAYARERGVADSVVFTGRQSKEAIPAILSSSDASLIHLKKSELFKTVIPSKIFETMAMQRPIIMGVDGEARDIVSQAGASLNMEPGCPHSLASAVERLADYPQLAKRLGQRARNFVSQFYNRDVLAAQYLDLLERVAENRGTLIQQPDKTLAAA